MATNADLVLLFLNLFVVSIVGYGTNYIGPLENALVTSDIIPRLFQVISLFGMNFGLHFLC